MGDNEPTPPAPPRRIVKRIARIVGIGLLAVLLTGMMAWAALAVALSNLSTQPPRYTLSALVLFLTVVGVIIVRPRRRKGWVPLFVFAVVLIWFLAQRPSNERDWRPEVARVAWADVRGDHLTLHNVRNFDYGPGSAETQRWEDRSYDLRRLKTADMILCYWGSKEVAHVITSFGFDDGQHLAISIETRRQKGESQSAIESLFHQYELIYVFGDERDLLRLRTNYRKEELYLYRSRMSPEQARAILLSYIERANALATHAEWYNTVTTNCATGVLPHARAAGAPGRWSLDIFFSGHAARQAYRNGMLDTSLPFEQLQERSLINQAAMAAENDPAFSQRIRAGLPGMGN